MSEHWRSNVFLWENEFNNTREFRLSLSASSSRCCLGFRLSFSFRSIYVQGRLRNTDLTGLYLCSIFYDTYVWKKGHRENPSTRLDDDETRVDACYHCFVTHLKLFVLSVINGRDVWREERYVSNCWIALDELNALIDRYEIRERLAHIIDVAWSRLKDAVGSEAKIRPKKGGFDRCEHFLLEEKPGTVSDCFLVIFLLLAGSRLACFDESTMQTYIYRRHLSFFVTLLLKHIKTSSIYQQLTSASFLFYFRTNMCILELLEA